MSNKPPDEVSALVEELAELARRAPARLGERLAALDVQQQARLALRLPARERLELLLHAPKPMRLVRSLPDSEFYLTVREVGPTDALPLVALGSAPQLQHLLDLESWRRDRFDPKRSGAWFALMLEAGESTIRRLIRASSDEQLTLLYQRWVRVEPIVPEDGHDLHGHGMTETGDEEGLVSPDGNYRFSPVIPEHGPAVQQITQIFFLDQPTRYRRLMWAAQYELPAEVEEQALRWRDSRLEEHGFPPWEEALSVYAPPEGVRSHPEPPAPTDPDGLSVPLSPMDLPAVRERLGSALDALPEERRERVLHEFFGLGNRVLMADGGDTGEPAAHRAALGKAAGYVGIALDLRGATDPDGSAETLARVPLLELFREGYTRTVDLQRRARVLTAEGWASSHPRALELLDTPLRERVEALLEPRPMYYEVGGEQIPSGSRPFRLSTELDQTLIAVEIAEAVGNLLVGRFGLDLKKTLEQERVERAELPRFSTFLLTFLAWHAARGELRGEPLPTDVVADFLRTVASRRTADPDAPARALGGWVVKLGEQFSLDAQTLSLVEAFGRACLEQLAAECASLDPGIPLDPRYVSCLLIEPLS